MSEEISLEVTLIKSVQAHGNVGWDIKISGKDKSLILKEIDDVHNQLLNKYRKIEEELSDG